MKFIKFFLLVVFLTGCLYIIESKYSIINQKLTSYEEKMADINEKIKSKQNEINTANGTLDLISIQNAKKTELYENLEKWNTEILTYINQ